MFACEYNLHNMESSLPQYHLKSNHLQDIIENKLSLTLASKKWLTNKGGTTIKGSTKRMCERHDKAYYKTTTRMNIEYPHSPQ
jgi:hypothetical protein